MSAKHNERQITVQIHTRSHEACISLHVLSALVRSQKLLTSKLNPPQDEEDEDGDEDYGEARTNHHPHHLKRKEQDRVCTGLKVAY